MTNSQTMTTTSHEQRNGRVGRGHVGLPLVSQMMVTSIGHGTGKRGINSLRCSPISPCDRNQFPNAYAN